MSAIVEVIAREILDSRGFPTVEADVILDSGAIGRFAVPSGASTGAKEALELRDGDENRYDGKGVLKAVAHVNTEICEALVGLPAQEQSLVDKVLIDLDGTPNKSRLGANAILAASVAVAKAAAQEVGLPLYRYLGGCGPMYLPLPMMNIINGGMHADNGLDFQEFMIIPYGITNFRDAIRCGHAISQELKDLCRRKGFSTLVGDEGGFAPKVKTHEEALDLICAAVECAGFSLAMEVRLALDCASSRLYRDGKYHIESEGLVLTSQQLVEYYVGLVDKFPIASFEDPFSEDDWEGWKLMTEEFDGHVQIVGDDLLVTNRELIEKAFVEKSINAALIKMNQIGTLTETLDAIDLAKRCNYGTILSHRSGETEDATIADIAVATNCYQIKIGALSRTDRLAKYNQLLRIEQELGEAVRYIGHDAFYNLKQH